LPLCIRLEHAGKALRLLTGPQNATTLERILAMKKDILTLSLAVGAILVTVQNGFAQGSRNCAARETVVNHLTERFGESRQSIGLGANNAVVETFASPETGTWTITVTMPNGMTCVVASGQAFETLAEDVLPSSLGEPT